MDLALLDLTRLMSSRLWALPLGSATAWIHCWIVSPTRRIRHNPAVSGRSKTYRELCTVVCLTVLWLLLLRTYVVWEVGPSGSPKQPGSTKVGIVVACGCHCRALQSRHYRRLRGALDKVPCAHLNPSTPPASCNHRPVSGSVTGAACSRDALQVPTVPSRRFVSYGRVATYIRYIAVTSFHMRNKSYCPLFGCNSQFRDPHLPG